MDTWTRTARPYKTPVGPAARNTIPQNAWTIQTRTSGTPTAAATTMPVGAGAAQPSRNNTKS